jgi:hypothetical protein
MNFGEKYFLSFADSRITPSAYRVRRQATALNVYDHICLADETHLDPTFRQRFHSHLKPGSRGFGYYVWKPQIIKQTLERMSGGDLLHYADAGCHLNPLGKPRLLQYFEMVQDSQTGILAFQFCKPSPRFPHDGRPLGVPTDAHWTKGDLFNYFGLRDCPHAGSSPQFISGVLFLKKTDATVAFVNAWLRPYEENFALADDTPSRSPNMAGFVEHRHDQSIFSLLCKIHQVQAVSAFETWYPMKSDPGKGDWDHLRDYPIHARRDKALSLKARLKKRLRAITDFRNLKLRPAIK